MVKKKVKAYMYTRVSTSMQANLASRLQEGQNLRGCWKI